MGLFDFLMNTGSNIKDNVGNAFNKIRYANAPQIQPLQVAENGGLDAQRTLELALAQPKSLRERLGGRTVSIDTESVNPETSEVEVNRISKYQPGLLDDIRAGARENFATGFAAPNWEQTVTPDGRKKGLGYRFGEGLGSFARFAESPLGRGLMMAGIVGAAGGSGLEALGYGTGAGLLNQQNRTKDQLYRNALEQQGVDTSNIKGYLQDDTFKNYSLANYRNRNLDTKLYLGQLSDNTKRAKLINTMLNTGELDPIQAVQLLGDYGIDVTELDTSNQTKLVPYKQYALQNGWNLGWANYDIKANKAAQEQAINDAVIKAIEGMGIKNNNGKNTVIIEAPDGTRKEVPASQKDYYIKKGGKVIG